MSFITLKEYDDDKIHDEFAKAGIINQLLHGINIHQNIMTKLHGELISGGFANYQDSIMSRNWKTEYWRATPAKPYVAPEPIHSRFEILDL